MPIPLMLCAEFLYTNQSSHDSFAVRLKDLKDIFRQLRNINDPTRNYMHLLEMSCTETASRLVNED